MSLPFDLTSVTKVTFFKRDEITTDLICCDVEVQDGENTRFWFNHEESENWQEWIDVLERLPGFATDWFARVSSPTFDPSVTVAYERPLA